MSLQELAIGLATYLYRSLFIRFVHPSTEFVIALALFPLVVVVDRLLGGRLVRARLSRALALSFGASAGVYLLNQILYPVIAIGIEAVGAASAKLPRLSEHAWEGVPFWVGVVVGMLAVDFASYWAHRAMHWKWFWPIHAIHHSDPVVSPGTALRVHVFQLAFVSIAYALFISWLRIPTAAVAVVGIVMAVHNQYAHLDVEWTHGPLRKVIVSPSYHRWHHTHVPEVQGKNLANVFPLWDILFGTYYGGEPCRDQRFGAEGVPEHDVVKLTLHPFAEWGRMVRAMFR